MGVMARKKYPLTIILAATLCTPFVYGTSFDCSKAASTVERLICSDHTLSGMDSELNRYYTRAREQATALKNTDSLRRYQLLWLREVRDRCLDVACLKSVYELRISQLKVPLEADNCDAAAKGVMAAIGTCEGSELRMTEEHLSNLTNVLFLTRALTDSQQRELQLAQADWRKNVECHCWNRAHGYNTGAAAIVNGCLREEVTKRIAEIDKILQGASLNFRGNSPPPGACKSK